MPEPSPLCYKILKQYIVYLIIVLVILTLIVQGTLYGIWSHPYEHALIQTIWSVLKMWSRWSRPTVFTAYLKYLRPLYLRILCIACINSLDPLFIIFPVLIKLLKVLIKILVCHHILIFRDKMRSPFMTKKALPADPVMCVGSAPVTADYSDRDIKLFPDSHSPIVCNRRPCRGCSRLTLHPAALLLSL